MRGKVKDLLSSGSEHFYYVGATVIAAGVKFLYSVFVKKYIEPFEYGIYSTCLLLQTYMAYIQLGSLNAFNRDYPQLIGAGDSDTARRYRNTTWSFLLLVFVVATVFFSTIMLVVKGFNGIDARYAYGFALCSAITTASVLENFLVSRVRIDGSFKYTSFVVVAELISVVIGFFIIPKLGYYGIYIVSLGSMLIGIALYYKRGISDLKFTLDKSLLKIIIISGLPLLVNSLIWTVVDSIDKFVILGFLDTEALGVYSIAQMAFSYMVLIPSAMSQLFYVRLGKIYGATKSVEKLNSTAVKYVAVLAIVINYIVVCAYFFMDPLVRLIMPKYIGGVKSAQILMVSLAIYAPTMVSGNILTILEKNAALLRGSIYLCVLNAVFSIGFVLLRDRNIESVAYGTAVSYLIRTLILIVQLKRNAGLKASNMLKVSVFPVLITVTSSMMLYEKVGSKLLGVVLTVLISTVVMYLANKDEIKSLIGERE